MAVVFVARMAVVFVALLLLPFTAATADTIQITGNPHISKIPTSKHEKDECLGGCVAAQMIDPTQIIMHPMATQPDTLMAVVTRKYLGVPVPLYAFRQSPRLTSRPLPFKLLLQRSIDLQGVESYNVPPAQAMDSWFLGYHWSVVVCHGCDGLMHLGWKFTSNANPADDFYALIVAYGEAEKEKSSIGSMIDAVMGELTIGVRAPAWISAMVVAKAAHSHSEI